MRGPGPAGQARLIAGATVTAVMVAPDGSPVGGKISFHDDGVEPDDVKDDGMYAALVADYPANGDFNIVVEVNNNAGTAQATFEGFQPAAGPIDPATGLPLLPVPAPAPVTGNFARSDRAQVYVSGVPAPGTAPAPVTLAPNNRDVAGKIEQAGAKNSYQIAVPGGFQGPLYVRVTSLANGMQPRLRLLTADGSTVLADLSRPTPRPDGYLFAFTAAAPGTTVLAEVTHLDAAARGGLYNISAGTRLTSDGKPLYLPQVGR